MDYQKIYNSLVEKRKIELFEGYGENHHIIPRCIGGLDEAENLVRLTAKEHLIAHLLLVKIYPNNKGLIYAANMMSNFKKYNSKNYQWLKEKFNKENSNFKHSDETKQWLRDWWKERKDNGYTQTEEHRRKNSEANKGEKNHFYGKTHTKETLDKIKKSNELRKSDPNYVNSNLGSKRTNEQRKKMSDKQKELSANKRKQNNFLNSNFQKYKVITPEGVEFTYCGLVLDLSKDFGLSCSMLKRYINKGIIPSCKYSHYNEEGIKTLGWQISIFYLS